MKMSLNDFKQYLLTTDKLLFNGINKYLVIENKQVLKKIFKLIRTTYAFKELSILMKYLLSENIKNELNEIHKYGKIMSNNKYVSSIKVNDIVYRLPVEFETSDEEETNWNIFNVFPYEDAFAIINYDNFGNTQITPGFTIFKRNIKTDNGNDWIRYYIGRKDQGALYKILCEKDRMRFYKVGISKNINNRIKQLSANMKIISSEYQSDYMLKNSIIERAFHIKYIRQKLHFNDKFDGCNECYVLDISFPTIEESLKILDKSNYTINNKLLQIILKDLDE